MSTTACLDERNARGSALARRLAALALLICGQALATPENTDAQGAQSSEPPNTAPGPHRPSLAGAVITTDVDTLSAWVTLAVSNIDPDETYAYEVVGAPTQGGSVETAYPRLRYAPPGGFVGSSALQVRLCSTAGVCSEPATVTFEVKDLDGIPDIVAFTIRTAEDTPSERVLVTVSDSTPGDTHTLEQLTDSPFGTLEIDGLELAFHPIDDFYGPTSVDVIACDAGGQCSAPFTVPITVTAVEDPPAIPDRIDLLAWENHPSEWLRVPATSADGYSALALRVETPPATGTVEIDVDDPLSIRYVPNPGATTDDTFRFTVCDPRPVCAPPATATLTLDARNSPPSASDIAIRTEEDTASTWVAVPIQDANPGDRHRITITQASPDGTAEVSQTRIRFVPLQDFNGTAAFQFRACDDKGACAPENLATVVVAPVADPPLVHPVMIHTQQDMASEIVEPAITDPDGGQTHTLEIIAQPRGGYAEISPLGIRFIPDPGFRGETTFDYRACDTARLCSVPAPARVTVTRTNTTPSIAPLSLELQEDTGTGLVAPLIHDPDPDEHHTLQVHTAPEFGQLVVAGAAFEYVPEQDWFGTDSAVLRVCDSLEECSEVSLAFTVNPVNDPPVASPMRVRTTEDTPSAPQTLAISDIDSISPPTVSVIQGSGGKASVISGEVLFTPDRDWAGATSFSIQVCDDAMACTTLDVPVLVEHVNDPPSVSPFTIVIDEDTSSAPVTVEFRDPDGLDTHTLVISQDPLRGAAQVVSGQMQVVYRPQPDVHGSDGFSVEICDQLDVCSEAEVTVVVNPVNDTPVALDLAIITKQDEPSEWVVANVADPDESDIHILRILSQPATALVELDPTRNALRAMPDPGATGIETFQIEVCDLAGACLGVDASVEIIRAQPFAAQASSVVVPVVANTELETGREHVIQSAAIVLQDGSGSPVEGILGVRVALSADAPHAYVVRGVLIEPGQTAAIGSVDFTSSVGRLAVPIRLAHLDGVASGFGGSLRFMLDDPYAPDVNTDITLWDPAESIRVSADKPAYARNVEPVVVSAAAPDEACPDGVFDYDRPQLLDAHASNRSYCAVRWTRLPPGLAQSALRTDPFVEGYLESEPGPETLTYEVGLVSWNAEGQFVFMPAARAGRIDLSVFDPPPPEITFEPSEFTSPGTAFLAQGRWRVNVGSGVMVGTIRAAADYPGLRLLIESPTAGLVESTSPHAAATAEIKTGLAVEEAVENVRIRAEYLRAPSIAFETQLSFVATDDAPNLRVEHPGLLTNAQAFALNVDLASGSDSASAGPSTAPERWSVRLYRINPNAAREALGEAVEMASPSGRVSISSPALAAGRHPLMVVAQPLRNDAAQAPAMESPMFQLAVKDASPIEMRLATSRRYGAAPANTLVSATPSDPLRAMDVAAIEWEYSDDGSSWTPIPRAAHEIRAFAHADTLSKPATRRYRATTVNRYSGLRALSNTVEVTAYNLPMFVLSGFTDAFVGHPVDWAAISTQTLPVHYAWTMAGSEDDPSPATMAGADQSLPADRPGDAVVTVRARFLASPEIPQAWRVISRPFSVEPPAILPPLIRGPQQIDSGSSATFTVATEHCLDPRLAERMRLDGRWILPDGTTTQGHTATYTAASGDRDVIRYEAWIDGYRASTMQAVEYPVTVRTYRWPEWTLYSNVLFPYTPARVNYEIKPLDSDTPQEPRDPQAPLTFDWTIPPGAVVERNDGRQMTLRFDTQGAWTVDARVSDTKGNSVALSETIDVVTVTPLTVALDVTVADSWARAPAEILSRWDALGLLPGERIQSALLSVNGKVVSKKLAKALRTHVPEPGKYTVTVNLKSSEGRTAIANQVVTLIAGDLPACTINVIGDMTRALEAQAVCKSPMGILTKFQWWVTYADTGETTDLGFRGSRIRMSSAALARGVSKITLVGVNDKQQESPPFFWSPP
jgi:hypothetical protein